MTWTALLYFFSSQLHLAHRFAQTSITSAIPAGLVYILVAADLKQWCPEAPGSQHILSCVLHRLVCQTCNPKGVTDLGALPLSQRDLLKLLGKAQLICQLEQVSHGVGPRGQNKDEGGGVAGVQKGACQVEGGRFCELRPQVLGNKALDCQRHLCQQQSLVTALFTS